MHLITCLFTIFQAKYKSEIIKMTKESVNEKRSTKEFIIELKNECVKPQEEVPRLEKRSHGEFVSAPDLKDNPLAKPKGFGFVEYDDYFMILVSLIYPFHSENVKQLFV